MRKGCGQAYLYQTPDHADIFHAGAEGPHHSSGRRVESCAKPGKLRAFADVVSVGLLYTAKGCVGSSISEPGAETHSEAELLLHQARIRPLSHRLAPMFLYVLVWSDDVVSFIFSVFFARLLCNDSEALRFACCGGSWPCIRARCGGRIGAKASRRTSNSVWHPGRHDSGDWTVECRLKPKPRSSTLKMVLENKVCRNNAKQMRLQNHAEI